SKNILVRFIRSRFNVTEEHHCERFFVRKANPRTGRLTWFITPLFMALVMVEVSDVIFAVDREDVRGVDDERIGGDRE
ncbi:hypothetical protein AB9F41_38210, partial [Rhizobium leguminosarum]